MTESPIDTTEENSANKENYENAQLMINKVLKKVEALKESETNDEIKRQIEDLDTAYERAIRLRMMRIDTLQAHCEDRNTELVKLRKSNHALSRKNKLIVQVVTLTVIGILAYILDCIMPGRTASVAKMARAALSYAIEIVQTSTLAAALLSAAITFLLQAGIARSTS